MGALQSKEKNLYDAVRQLDLEAIISYHARGANLNWFSPSGKTPLILACSSSDLLPAAFLLLELGADVNYYCPSSNVGTALKTAAERGLERTVNLLLGHGANPLLEDRFRRNSLNEARNKGHTWIVRAIEDKICLFSCWLLASSNHDRTFLRIPGREKIWAVFLPGNNSLSREIGSLKIALYIDKQSPRPLNIIDSTRFTFVNADFSSEKSELLFSHIGYAGAHIKLLSNDPDHSARLRAIFESSLAMPRPNAPPPNAPPLEEILRIWNVPSFSFSRGGDDDMAKAIAASIQSATQEGILQSDIEERHVSHVPERGSSCVVCVDSSADVVCIPCGHVAGCFECMTEVKRKGFGCPVCRVPIERILKVYMV